MRQGSSKDKESREGLGWGLGVRLGRLSRSRMRAAAAAAEPAADVQGGGGGGYLTKKILFTLREEMDFSVSSFEKV